MSDIVIIGGGECGARAAFALRERGFDGSVTLVCAESHLPYERPPLSKATLIDALEPKLVADGGRYLSEGITVLTGCSVLAIDRVEKSVTLSGGRSLHYDRLLLTVGARSRLLPGMAEASGRIRTLRSHDDALAIRTALHAGGSLVIIGGGFIGLELAATARMMGVNTTLIEGLARILSRGVPEDIAEAVAARHRAEGVEILCGQAISAIEDGEEKATIRLVGGRTIAADLVVVGIGAVPNTALAEAAGLAVENGIAVDRYLCTSDPDIFAAGDCCSFPLDLYGGRRVRLEAWRNAQEQGNLAAANLMGAAEPVSNVPWFWSDHYDMTLQITGLADGATTTVRRPLGDGAFILFHLDREGRLLAASGIGKGNAVARDIRLAEMLISAAARPDPHALASPATKLKSLLAA